MSRIPSVARPPAPDFDVELRPVRSLSVWGAALVLTSFAVPALAMSAIFLSLGLWPIGGFLGLDIAGLVVAFFAVRRSGRRRERLTLASDRLIVRRVAPDGREDRFELQPYWLRVEVGQAPRHLLSLVTHGRRFAIGEFLNPGERLALAQALREALAR